MPYAALIVWILTASLGTYMVVTWRKHGGLAGSPPATHFPPARVFTHLGLAVVGLVIWVIYLSTNAALWAWVAVGDLVLVALLGVLLVRRWTLDGRAAMANTGSEPRADLAEQHIERTPVVLHGILAASTFVLVLLTALGVGR
ncbi:MAG TPA: hypothetical protein VFU98_00690 [Microlunatus sp.]|nr:hypothetical protein [Microlunatus sp.]